MGISQDASPSGWHLTTYQRCLYTASCRDESRDVYQLFVERTGKAATIITSNRDTADWLAVFDDPLLGQGAVDRFKNNAYDLVVDGESYRSRLKPSIDKDGPPPAAPVTKPKPLLRRRKRARA